MDAAASAILDSAGDLARRFSDAGDSTPDYADIAAGYARLGLPPGSAILIFAPNGVEFLLQWIAVLAAGYVPCAVAPATKRAVVDAVRRSLQIAAVAGPWLDPANYDTKHATRIGRFDIIVFDAIPPQYDPFDVLILTTGTSGSQTACVHRLSSLAWNAGMTNRTLGLTTADRQLIVLPMYHSYGLVTQSIGSILSGGEVRIDGPPFNANRFAELIDHERISVCGITPTIARDLLKRGTMLPRVRSISIGGDRMSPEEVQALLDTPYVDELYITYGLTETGPRVSVLPAHDAPGDTYDSVGRPFDGIAVRIDAPDPAGVGQLLVKTPSVCRRKVGDNITHQPFTADGFLATGDLFTQDDAGYLRYVSRKADVLIVNGEKLNVTSINRVAESHPDVEFARTGPGDEHALVTRLWAKDGKVLDLDQIRTFLKSSLRLHELPDRLVQQDSHVFHK